MTISVLCPHCRAENITERHECWRCKHSLPTPSVSEATPSGMVMHITLGNKPTELGRVQYRNATVMKSDNGIFDISDREKKRLIWLFSKRVHPS